MKVYFLQYDYENLAPTQKACMIDDFFNRVVQLQERISKTEATVTYEHRENAA